MVALAKDEDRQEEEGPRGRRVLFFQTTAIRQPSVNILRTGGRQTCSGKMEQIQVNGQFKELSQRGDLCVIVAVKFISGVWSGLHYCVNCCNK